jgi:hypothetical protein
MLGGGEPHNRQADGGEGRGAAGAHAGQRGEDLSVAAGQQGGDLAVDRGDVGGPRAPAGQAALQPGRPDGGVGRWRQAGPPSVDPELRFAGQDPAVGSSPQRAQAGRSTGEGGGAVEHRLPDDAVDLQRPAVSVRGGQTRAQRVQLVVQPLPGDLVLGDQAAA